MSEPLYRVWSIALMQYLRAEGGYFVNLNGYVHDNLTDDNANRQDMFIIQRCTGEQDVNGKYIYEGDIVEHYPNASATIRAVVEFHYGNFDVRDLQGYKDITIEDIDKIIGNSLENPELLLEKEEE